MPKRTNEFQKIIKFMYDAIARLNNEYINIEESVLVKEINSNIEREIDILITGKFANHTIKIAVECRDRKYKDDIIWIDELIGKYSKLPIDKIVAISKKGFTKNAIEKAKNNNIEVISVKCISDVDWKNSLNKLNIGYYFMDISLLNISIIFQEKNICEFKLNDCFLLLNNKNYNANNYFLDYFNLTILPLLKNKQFELLNTYFNIYGEKDNTMKLYGDLKSTNEMYIIYNKIKYKILNTRFVINIKLTFPRINVKAFQIDNNLIYYGEIQSDTNKDSGERIQLLQTIGKDEIIIKYN